MEQLDDLRPTQGYPGETSSPGQLLYMSILKAFGEGLLQFSFSACPPFARTIHGFLTLFFENRGVSLLQSLATSRLGNP